MSAPFAYRASKAGDIFISWDGRVVTTLRGAKAAAFVQRAETSDQAGRQALMQRTTGNFKRGNER
jgi:hypothetical protein